MWKIMVADHKNQAPHRNEVSQNALLENCICFIFRQMTFLRQKLAENRTLPARAVDMGTIALPSLSVKKLRL